MTQTAASALDPREGLQTDAASREPIIAKRLLRYCLARTRDRVRAEDAASEAVLRTLAAEGWHRWTHDGKHPPAVSLLNHLCNMANDVIRREWQRGATSLEVHVDAERRAPPDAADPAPAAGERSPDSEKHMTEMRRAELVMAALDEDAREMLRVEAESDEELDPKEIAERLGWTVKQVHRTRERVFYRRDELLAREKSMKKRAGSS
jgi:DNA-directed RNA polymerase specialized sigma24 family protein